MPLLAFDGAAYGAALNHVGEPVACEGWPGPVLRRPIASSDQHDLVGAWPYATPPSSPSAVANAWAAMQDDRAVTFQALARPDQTVAVETLREAGFAVQPLKLHYVRRPELPPRPFSARTRANLSRARRTWSVTVGPLRPDRLVLLCSWHEELARRRHLTGVVALPSAHFHRLATIDGFTALWAEDAAGPGACLLVAEESTSIHFHTIAGDERAYRTRAFYALYDEAVRCWPERTLYFGGAPDGADGPGIAQFKERFANDTVRIQMISAVLDSAACAALCVGHAATSWFPPYRAPLLP